MLAQILAQTIDSIFRIFFWLIFIRAILSWIRPSSYGNFIADLNRVLYVLTEPILAPIRNLLPGQGMGVDFSPFIAMILLNILQGLTRSLILHIFS